MPIYDYNGSVHTQIGKIYDWNGSANTQIGKVYDHNGSAHTLIYTAETPLSELSVDCPVNWVDYKQDREGTSSGSWNLSGFSSVSFSTDITASLGNASPNGRGGTFSLYLDFGGSSTLIFERTDATAGPGGTSWHMYGNNSVNLSGKSLATVRLKIKTSKLFSYGGEGGPINASARIYNVIAT